MKTVRAQAQNGGGGAEVIIHRSVAGNIAYDVKATGPTVQAAGVRAREEFELMCVWADRRKEQEQWAADERKRAADERKDQERLEQLARSAGVAKK